MILAYIGTLIAYVIGEFLWLRTMFPTYKRWFSSYNPTLQIQSFVAVVLTYIVLLGSFVYLILMRPGATYRESFFLGATFGLVVYFVYNGTNVATLPRYSWQMVLADTAWGAICFGSLSVLFKFLMRVTN